MTGSYALEIRRQLDEATAARIAIFAEGWPGGPPGSVGALLVQAIEDAIEAGRIEREDAEIRALEIEAIFGPPLPDRFERRRA
jgi:hypothetical protein